MLTLHQVIEDVSSCLGDSSLEMTQHIASNHMDMCRFSGFHDVEYLKVAAALDHIQKRVTEGSVNLASPGLCTAFVAQTHLFSHARNKLGTQRRSPTKIYGISMLSGN